MTLTRIDTATGAETQAGIFLAEKPTVERCVVIRVTAYDRMTLLDRNLSSWLREQQGSFPMALSDLIRAVCGQCGVLLADGTLDGLPNGAYPVRAFYADDLTGRQLIQWAAQAACRFARMTPAGTLEFAWYTESALTGIGPGSGRRMDGAEPVRADLHLRRRRHLDLPPAPGGVSVRQAVLPGLPDRPRG